MVVRLTTQTSGSTRTISPMKPVLFTKVVVGLMVLDAVLCPSAVTAKLAKLASSQMNTISTRLKSMVALRENKQ